MLACRWPCSGRLAFQTQMTMIRLSHEQRRMLVDKLPDTANLGLGALVFGQFLQDRPFSRWLAAAGVFVWVTLIAWALFVGRRINL